MESFVQTLLIERGYGVNTDAFSIIQICDDWYANRVIEDFHTRRTVQGQEYDLNRMNMAKRCCVDDANLCEIVSVAPESGDQSKAFIDELLQSNRFDVRYREQLEKTAAVGTVGAYIYLKNAKYLTDDKGITTVRDGDIKINYVDADCIIPLTIENGLVTEAAFSATAKTKGKNQTTLVIFAIGENGLYTAETIVFDASGKQINDLYSMIQLGEVKPFAIMQNAEVNNLDNMEGYGLPKIYNTIPVFKAIDLCYNVLFGDLDKAEKIVLINEMLCTMKKDDDGNPYLTPEQKKIFMLLGERLPEQDSLIKEYNPEIRIDQITKCFELVLSLVSMSFGYGTKKYTFENGQIKTATEYAGEKQDAMQELNKQRRQASDYITDIIHSAMWFSNQFKNTSYDVTEDMLIQFDDSYVEDKAAKLEAMRADAISFPEISILKVWYLMDKYNIPEEEAKAYIQYTEEPIDDVED